MSNKVKVIKVEDFQNLMSRLASSYLRDVSKDKNPAAPIDLFSEKSKAKADLCISLGQNISASAIEIDEGALS